MIKIASSCNDDVIPVPEVVVAGTRNRKKLLKALPRRTRVLDLMMNYVGNMCWT